MIPKPMRQTSLLIFHALLTECMSANVGLWFCLCYMRQHSYIKLNLILEENIERKDNNFLSRLGVYHVVSVLT